MPSIATTIRGLAAAGLIAAAIALPRDVSAAIGQQAFASAQDAVAALIEALRKGDDAPLRGILGPDSDTLLHSGDRHADAASRARFVATYDTGHAVTQAGPDRALLQVGAEGWTLPIPLVKTAQGWRFDTAAGAQEMIARRIGRNEIAAVRTALAYVAAQRDFMARGKAAGGTGQYAQRLVSTPGRQDGLYWPDVPGTPASPLAPLVRQAVAEGYPGAAAGGKPIPYQGYHFRILTAQGANAPGGAASYIVDGRMTGGFALVAWPASYGVSGIMTFIVGPDGVVFQKDLGGRAAPGVRTFDPDLGWTRVDLTGG